MIKDQHTIICGKDDMYMNTAGNHALAKGAAGDVLCGILTGLYAQGKEALQAAAAAVYVHACAADELTENGCLQHTAG
ncbi:MAG: NAD(P)H-hydrate dehydratase [[Clostridium] innocuum]